MTSRVYINIEADTSVEAREQMARLLGLDGDFMSDEVDATVKEMLDTAKGTQADEDTVVAAEGIRPETPDQPIDTKPTRERGQPSPGKARRTKAEIAEDDAAANVAHDVMTEPGIKIVSESGVVADEIPLISTGEERVGPEDDEATQAADAADEAAETAAATAERAAEGKPALTLDDIRTVLGNYQKVYGLPAAMEDGPKVLSEIVSGAAKVSDIPEDKIADAIAALKAAGKTNRFKRAAVTA